ncbi:MAG: DUF4259 domain-containing protein [Phycisphaerales bacterium JB039]
MGAWGVGPFENDLACDWVYGLEDDAREKGLLRKRAAPFARIDRTLGAALTATYELWSDAEETLAAAEAVAAARGRPCPDLPEEFEPWLPVAKAQGVPPGLVTRAIEAARKARETSELRSLWEKTSDNYIGWLATVDDLLARLQGPG